MHSKTSPYDIDNSKLSLKYKNKNGENVDVQFKINYTKETHNYSIYKVSKLIGAQSLNNDISELLETKLSDGLLSFSKNAVGIKYAKVDASSLNKLATKIAFTKDESLILKIQDLADQEKQEQKELRELKVNNKLIEGISQVMEDYRIFIDQDSEQKDHYKVCIDNSNHTFLKCNKEQLPTLVSYLKGDSFLRRKHHLAVEPFPINKLPLGFDFIAQKNNLGSLAKADDTANALANSGLSQKMITKLEGLIVFPEFISLLELGISDLIEEGEENVEAIKLIQRELDNFKEISNDLEIIIEKATKKNKLDKGELLELKLKIEECSESIQDLANKLNEFPEAIKSYNTSSNLGFPSMAALYVGTAASQIQAFANLFGGLKGVTYGLEGTSFVNKINLHNGKLGKNLNSKKSIGFLGVAGNLILSMRQFYMVIFALRKMLEQGKKVKEIENELQNIESSETLSPETKKVLKAVKNDEKFYTTLRSIANGTISLGHGMMLLCGPVGFGVNPGFYVGAAISSLGEATNTSVNFFENKKYDLNEELNSLEKEIFNKINSKILDQYQIDIERMKLLTVIDKIKKKYPQQNFNNEQIQKILSKPELYLLTGKDPEKSKFANELNAAIRKKLNLKKVKTGLYSLKNFVDVEAIFNTQKSVHKYLEIQKEGQAEIEFLAHLQSIPLCYNKVFNEALKQDEPKANKASKAMNTSQHNIYSKLKEKVEKHYASNPHQIELKENLNQLKFPKKIVNVLNEPTTNEKSEMMKIALWSDTIEKLTPNESDLKLIKELSSLINHPEKTEKVLHNEEIPTNIKEDLKDVDISNKSEFYFKVKQSYMNYKLDSLTVNQYQNMSANEITTNVASKILESDLKLEFSSVLMKENYKSKDKKSNKYAVGNTTSPIALIGTVQKVDKKLLGHLKTHNKNIYQLNEASIKEGNFIPSKKSIVSVLKSRKFELRSNYLRDIKLLNDEKITKEAVGPFDIKNMTIPTANLENMEENKVSKTIRNHFSGKRI